MSGCNTVALKRIGLASHQTGIAALMWAVTVMCWRREVGGEHVVTKIAGMGGKGRGVKGLAGITWSGVEEGEKGVRMNE